MADKLHNLALRSRFLRAVRDFFYSADFLEVETSVRIAAPAPEEYIEAVPSGEKFLRTSPELEMKCLLADGMQKIFQIGSCFRLGEFGRKHREEFTMLEFYAAQWDYLTLADFTASLVMETTRKLFGTTQVEFQGKRYDLGRATFISVDDAFQRYAKVSAFQADADGSFDELMVTKVEPELGREGLTFLIDYPANRASLSKISENDPRVARRWELYLGGVELANAFGELTDAAEQKMRFLKSAEFRAREKMARYPEPEAFYAALDKGLPESSGCALGIDRLVMILCNADNIGEVRA
ncbi:MAG: EF-P lysine aminoacylase GenX [Victivallaceae bacterium]|nr:EF-P lysine aminoacylase GenX [Victivallaceae bacterium]